MMGFDGGQQQKTTTLSDLLALRLEAWDSRAAGPHLPARSLCCLGRGGSSCMSQTRSLARPTLSWDHLESISWAWERMETPLRSVPVGGPRRPGRRGKERPEPSGSLPWDTSCTALGPRRSPHLSGSLPRLPAEVYAGGDIRHPRPARPSRPRPAPRSPGLGAGPRL